MDNKIIEELRKIHEIEYRQIDSSAIVVVEFACVKIDVAAGEIGVALVDQSLDHFDELGNAGCRRFDDVRLFDVELGIFQDN